MKFRVVGSSVGFMLGLLMVASVHAGWGSWGGYYGGSSGYSSYGGSGGYAVAYGSSGGYSSYGSSGGYSSYGSSGGVAVYYGSSGAYGSSGGFGHHFRAHMAAKRARIAARHSYHGSSGYSSYGSSGGYSSHGSSGGYSSYGSSGGYSSHGSSGGYSSYSTGGSSGGSVSYGSVGTTTYSYPTSSYSVGKTYYSASTTPTSLSALSLVSQTQDDSVYLTVTVPSNAKIFVNGNETTSKGTVRQFVSRGLKAGKSYRFQVRAELEVADGDALTDEQELVVTAGQSKQVHFAFDQNDSQLETAVTLNVPENAEVTLAGSATKVTGATRVYRTDRLKPGDVWDDYEIQVRVGDQLKSQKIRLIAGDQLELTFNFDNNADRLASR